MKIKKLTISNFRGIKHLDLDFSNNNGVGQNLIILAGINGAGKTSILEALLLLLGRKNMLPERNQREQFDIRAGSNGYEISATIEFEGIDFNVIKTSGSTTHTEQLKAFYQKTENIPVEYFPSWRIPKLVGSVSVTTGKKGKRPMNTMENRLWRLKQYFVDLTARKSFTKSGEEQKKTEDASQEALLKLNRIWKLMYPQRNETLAAEIAGEDILEGFDLYLLGRTDERIPVDSLSSGELELLTMLGRFIKDDFTNGIILLDEPELHLHPSWHRIVVTALQEFLPKSQIIVATHSPLVIGDISEESLNILKMKDSTIKALKPQYSYGLDANRVLEELMGTDERVPIVKEELSEIFRLIGNGKLNEGRVKIKKMREKMPEEPELTRAEAIISRKEILGK